MGERIEDFLNPDQKRKLEEMGRKGDKWRQLLREVGGDEELAELLADVRGISAFGIPDYEKPKLEGSSPRVAAQKHATRRQG
jgi:hypothetical protein